MWDHGRIRLLAVDDESDVRGLIGDALQGTRYACVTAASYPEAVQRATEDGRIDLLLCDIIIPPFHGRDLANRLVHLHPDLKVLFMSGYPTKLLRQHSLLAPASVLLPKPFTPTELLNSLDGIWDTAKPWVEAAFG
jgi:CheY-like chemotaxis protein